MSIRKCPRCGLPVADMQYCPKCGENVGAWYSRMNNQNGDNTSNQSSNYANNSGNTYTQTNNYTNNGGNTQNQNNINKTDNSKSVFVTFNNIKMTPWEVAFILICNIAFVLTLVNILVGGACWCHYPVLALFVCYFFAFACASKSLKRFLTRYRNAVFITNIIAGIYNIIYNAMTQGSNLNWALDYFVPINLIVACTVMLMMMLIPNVSIRNVMFSAIILLVQSIIQFLLFAFNLTGNSGRVSVILISVAFGVNLITVINYVFIYFIKCRNVVFDKFRLWE